VSSLSLLPTVPATRVEGCFLRDSYLFLECELDRIVGGFEDNDLIAGRVVAAHVHEEALRAFDRDDSDLVHGLPLLAYLNPGRYAAISRTYSFPFPKDFSR
jgi:flavin reductase (DIM6/NTAB) family NADH-FMN oxidoreductase RutF